MEEIYKNHIKIGDYIIQYETSWAEEDREEGYYIIGKNRDFGPYNHVYDAIETVLQWQNH